VSVPQPQADPHTLLAADVARAGVRPRAPASQEPRWCEAPPDPVAAGTAEPESPARLSGTRPPAALILAAAACIVAPPLVLLDGPSWMRFPALLLLLSLAPGTTLLRLLQPLGQRIEVGLAVGVGFAVTAVAAQGMLWAGAWHPKLFVFLLASICLAGMASARPGLSGPRRIRARRHERPARLDPAVVAKPHGGAPDSCRDARVASVVVRAHGESAALALVLRELLSGVPAAGEGTPVRRPVPRRFSAEYKLRILREAQACARNGEVAALLRRERLCASHLAAWRTQRDAGTLAAPERKSLDRRDAHSAELRRRAQRAEAEFEKARRRIASQADARVRAGELLEPSGIAQRRRR
jgi:transposase-like protein